jgi:hypothetical protein
MALKHLTTAQMVSLSGPLVQAGHPDRMALATFAELNGLLPKLTTAHTGLLDTHTPVDSSEQLVTIRQAQKQLDGRFDDLARGIHSLPLALAYLVKSQPLAQQLRDLQQVLTPDGLALVQKSYREEAGQAALLESRLTGDHVSLMKTIQTPEGTLEDAVLEFISTGKQLGALEDSRAAVQKTGPTPADAVKARNRWIRTINAMLSLIELLDEPSEAVRAIVQRIQIAAAKAEINQGTTDDARTSASEDDSTMQDPAAPAVG